MGTTERQSIPFPEETTANDYPEHMKQLAQRVDLLMLGWSTGKFSDRPAAGNRGRVYEVSTDPDEFNNGRIFFDTGTKWREITVGRPVRYSGTLVGGGIGSVTHEFGAGIVSKLQYCQAWFKGNSGEATTLTVGSIDGGGVNVSGGTAGRIFYVSLAIADTDMPWA